jgi:general nucleoside transport system ATP-binding protein
MVTASPAQDLAVGAPGTPPMVLMRGIAKYFPGVIANANVDLEVLRGEIHALLGENGAGKSTLMNILTGIYQPDAGEIIIDGYGATFASPIEAIAVGIGMVHQHFKLVQAFTVAENVHLGWSETPRRASAAQLEARTRALAERFNLDVRPDARVADLSAGEQQRVEILRVLAREARVLILDEPTAVLTPAEARELFKVLRKFRARGNAVIFISHKLDEVLEISDRVTILRDGRKVATRNTADCNHRMLATLMVGREIVLGNYRDQRAEADASRPAVLSLRGVSALDDNGRTALKEVDLDVRAGEILGLAGVAGNGQRELSQVMTGLRPITSGQVSVDGKVVRSLDPTTFARLGIGHIPEDRLRSGIAPSLSITDNTVLREYKREPVARGPFFNPHAATALARTIANAASVAVPDFGMPVRNLSGGNQQRLVARREMRISTKLLVAAYPSRGLDVGAINTMLNYFVELREAGVAVVLISEELDELLNLSDRIAVIYEGRIMGTFKTEDAELQTVGLLMGGQKHPENAVRQNAALQ